MAHKHRFRIAAVAVILALSGCGESSIDEPGASGGAASGGAVGSGGTTGSGGAVASGGTTAIGGAVGSGGATTSGGVTGFGGAVGSGGLVGTGGAVVGTGGLVGTGGVVGTGGAVGSGGAAGGTPGGTEKITVWLAGDSTMADGSSSCPVGWGKQFQSHFNSNAKVVNSAVGGTTVRSWLYNVTSTLGGDGECVLNGTAPQSRWTTMVNSMKQGDYLFVQFGINDTTSASCPKHVSVATFKMLFGMMAQAAKDKGAQPVFLTAVSSISCDGAVARGTRGGFAAVTKEAGVQYGVPVIDLEQLSVALYTSLGFCPSTDSAATFSANTPIGNFFCSDHTHFESGGARQIAAVVAKAIRDQGLGLASYLVSPP